MEKESIICFAILFIFFIVVLVFTVLNTVNSNSTKNSLERHISLLKSEILETKTITEQNYQNHNKDKQNFEIKLSLIESQIKENHDSVSDAQQNYSRKHKEDFKRHSEYLERHKEDLENHKEDLEKHKENMKELSTITNKLQQTTHFIPRAFVLKDTDFNTTRLKIYSMLKTPGFHCEVELDNWALARVEDYIFDAINDKYITCIKLDINDKSQAVESYANSTNSNYIMRDNFEESNINDILFDESVICVLKDSDARSKWDVMVNTWRVKYPLFSFKKVIVFQESVQVVQIVHIKKMVSEKESVTLVSAYYNVPSKTTKNKYLEWARNFFAIPNVNLVFYTDAENSDVFKGFNRDTKHTLFKTLPLSETEAFQKFGTKFEKQFNENMDPEKILHKSHLLYLIWTQKNYFLERVANENPFNSTHFLWCDVGCFRDDSVKMENFPLLMPAMTEPGKVLISLMDKFNAKDNENTDFTFRSCVTGAIFGGDKKAILQWVEKYEEMVNSYILQNRFAGKDQNIYASLILKNPELVTTILNPKENLWFGFQDSLSGKSPLIRI